MKRVKLVLHGTVQGVFYREHAMSSARKLGIKGYVKNLPDGTVEVIGEGDDRKIAEFVRMCKKGSFKSIITKVDEAYETPAGEYETFLIEF